MATVDTDVYRYRKEGFFFFDNSTVNEIMKTLGEWYDMNVVFRSASTMHHHMHYFCDRTGSIDEALRMFNTIGKTRAIRDGYTIYIE